MDYTQLKQFELRRKFCKLVGAEIFIDDPASQQEVGYIKMKAWKLREDIRIYRGRDMAQEIAQIHARQIIDFGATYDVLDGVTQQPVFSLRRKGLKSTFVRDHWNLLDTAGNQFGTIQETSSGLALARRWLELLPYGDIIGLIFAFIPQTYTISLAQPDGSAALIANIVHRKNPFVVKMSVDTSAAQVPHNPLVVLVSAAMLSIIDASKNS